MALHIYADIIQGSEEWHDLRRGMVTASTVGKLLTPTLKVADNEQSRGLTATLVAERLSGFTEDGPMTSDMWRGVETEPLARDWYSGHYHQAVECGFVRRDEDGWSLGLSPDGLVGDVGGLEVKSPRAKTHVQTVLADEVPAHYMPQVQAALLVTGRDWWDWMSYVGGMAPYVKRVYPDPDWFAAIEAACRTFETNATSTEAEYRRRVAGRPVAERVHTPLDVVI